MTTDPTADAIAALTQAAELLELTDDTTDHDYAKHCREVRSALLSAQEQDRADAAAAGAALEEPRERVTLDELKSELGLAQGQAGKPVATDAMAREALGVYLNPDDANLSQLDDMRDALNAALALGQPQPAAGATAALITALEAAEKALGRLASDARFNAGFGFAWATDELAERQAFANTAQSACTSALATIKGLET